MSLPLVNFGRPFQPPSYYIVTEPNPYLKAGTMLRRFDDGYEEVVMTSQGGKQRIAGFVGLIYPHRTLGPFLTAVLKKGLDKGTNRQIRRKKMEQCGE